MNLHSTIDLHLMGTPEGVKKSWDTRGRKLPQGSPGSTKLTGTEAFKDPVNKSFIVTTGGKVYGTAAPMAHDTMMIFHQPHLKNDLRKSAVNRFVEGGGIRAGIASQGHAYIEIGKATPDVLKRLVQTIEHIQADEIEMQIGKDYFTGPKDKVYNAVRQVLAEKTKSIAASSIFANYALDRRTMFQGLMISIENDTGSTRKGVGKDGKPWSVTMSYPYGYIRQTEGVDGDHVDCFLGPNEQAVNAYVIHTTEPTTGDYDEDKVMLGFDSANAAKKAFLANYSSKKFFGSMDTIPMEKFKEKVLATKQNPKKIAAQSKFEDLPKVISVGDQVTVDGLPGRGTATMIDGGRIYIRYRNGFEVSRAPNFVHVISGRMVKAGGPGSGPNAPCPECGPHGGRGAEPRRSRHGTMGPVRPGRLHSYQTGSVIQRMFETLKDGQPHGRRELDKQFGGHAAVAWRLWTLAQHGPQSGNWRLARDRRNVTLILTPRVPTQPVTPAQLSRTIQQTQQQLRDARYAEAVQESRLGRTGQPTQEQRPRPSLPPLPQRDARTTPLQSPGTQTVQHTVVSGFRKPEGFLKKDAPTVPENINLTTVLNRRDFTDKFGMSPEDYRATMIKGLPVSMASAIKLTATGRGDDWNIRLNGGGLTQTRSFNLGDKSVDHDLQSLPENMQSKGLAKTLFANAIDMYDHLGIKTVTVHAGLSGGGYAWARYGFVPTQSSWDTIRSSSRSRLARLDPPADLAARVKMVLDMPDPKSIWLLASLKDEVGNTTIGKKLLMGTGWIGKIDLSNETNYRVVKAYTESKKIKAMLELLGASKKMSFDDAMLDSDKGEEASDFLAINFAMSQGWPLEKAANWFANHKLRSELTSGSDDVDAESEMDESLTIKKNRPKSDWFNVLPGNKGGKQPASAALIKGYGTSEGVSKSWDTRGRGQKLILGDTAPPKDKPVTLVFGGSFNPPHIGHSQTAETAAELLRSSGYNVAKIVIAPTADRLLKAKLGDRMYPLAERTELAKRTFPSSMEVSPKPAEEAEITEGKLRRTQLADSVQSLHPDNTVINVTGEDAAPGHPPGYPSLYEGEGNHKGYYYLAIGRPPDSLSSSQIRQQLLEGKPVKGMTPEAEKYLHSYLSRKSVHSSVRAYGTSEGVKKSWDTRGRGRHTAEELRREVAKVAFEHDQHERIKAVLEKEANDPKVKAAIALSEKLGDSRNFPGVSANGHYTPEADAENQKIAESFIHADALPKPGEPPVAVFMLGKTGAGKSTLVKNMAGEMPPTVMINSDDVKERIKGYTPEAAQPYHERSCDIARNYLEPMAVKGGYNLTFDMTDNQERLVKTVQRLKESGYKIALLMAHVDDATSAERAYARFQTKGRYVPLKVALSYGTKPQEAYQKVRDSGLADEWRAYDTSTKGEPVPLDSGTKDETWSVFKHRSLGGVGASRARRSGAWSGGTKGWKGWKEKEVKEVSGIGEPDVPMTGGHISPIPTFHPPSLINPRLVPQPNDPKETDDRYLDVTKRKEAYQHRLKMLRRSAPGGLPAMMPAGTTGLAQHMGVAPSVYSSANKKVKQRPVRQHGINRTFLR